MTGDALRAVQASLPWWIRGDSRWAYAILAQSRHDTQPRKFPVIPGELLLMAERSRSLPVVDPFDREPLISRGATPFSLRVAFARCGGAVETTPFRQAANSDLGARISFPCGGRFTVGLNELSRAISEPPTRGTGETLEPLPLPAEKSRYQAAYLHQATRMTRPSPLMAHLGRGATAPHALRRSHEDVLS
jgi:hypothetical protein